MLIEDMKSYVGGLAEEERRGGPKSGMLEMRQGAIRECMVVSATGEECRMVHDMAHISDNRQYKV